MKRNMRKQVCSLDSLGSSVSQDSAPPSDDQLLEDEDELEDDAFGICFTTTESKCEELYEQGVLLKSQGRMESALNCFVEALKRMQESQYFAKLPYTLHELAELYHAMERYDKAVEFAQAEKLFYEAVLVDYHGAKHEKETRRTIRGCSPGKAVSLDPSDYANLLVNKASEFERLSRLCAKHKNFELALDYCGKAAKIRQSVYGPEHPSTVATLECFTDLYAEVGRTQYAAAMNAREDTSPATNPLPQPIPASLLHAPEEPDNSAPANFDLQVNKEETRMIDISSSQGEGNTDISSSSNSCGDSDADTCTRFGLPSQEAQSFPSRFVDHMAYSAPLWIIVLAAVIILALSFA